VELRKIRTRVRYNRSPPASDDDRNLNLLALETATDACSAALLCGETLIEHFELAPRRHAEILLPMIEELLTEAGIGVSALDGIAFGAGPGAFTGLRIAAAFTQGIALAHDLPVAPVSSLAALALGAAEETGARALLAAFDARMGEVYFGGYTLDPERLVACTLPETVCPPGGIPCPADGDWLACGSGWAVYEAPLREAFQARCQGRIVTVHADCHPRASAIARLGARMLRNGGGVPADLALPSYLRDLVTR
jgi:tRNA threonylcarbamoyladenosine biosynthesis protein TsaB